MAKVQLIVVTPIASCLWTQPNRKPGDAVWVDDGEPARHLLENGFCKWPEVAEEPPAALEKKPLRRTPAWPTDRFAVVERVWVGETVVCIGGGPSVTQEAVNLTKGRARVIAINNSYLLAPWAEICYFADARWWELHKDRAEFKAFAGQKATIEPTGLNVADPAVFMLHNDSKDAAKDGLSERSNAIRTGSNGGYQAINIAMLTGAKRILLLGYDMHYVASPKGKKSHWHEGHPWPMPEMAYSRYARRFASMNPQLARLGVEVINCTPGSLIDAFPRGDIASLLAHQG